MPSAACPGEFSFQLTQMGGPPSVGTVTSSMTQRDMPGSSGLEGSVKGSGKGIKSIWAMEGQSQRAMGMQGLTESRAEVIPISTTPCKADLIDPRGLKGESVH